jgi:fatty-acyl-CoA synthase
MEGIDEIAVVGVPDKVWGYTGHAFIVSEEAVTFDIAAVHQHCHERLARYKIPKQITFVKDLPRTALGKVRKKELLRQLEK